MNRALVKSFVGVLRQLPDDERLEILREAAVKEKPRDPDSWKKLVGAWPGSETAEELIEIIKGSQVNRPDQEPL